MNPDRRTTPTTGKASAPDRHRGVGVDALSVQGDGITHLRILHGKRAATLKAVSTGRWAGVRFNALKAEEKAGQIGSQDRQCDARQ